MPPTLTKDELVGMIDEMIGDKIGSTIKERMDEFASKQTDRFNAGISLNADALAALKGYVPNQPAAAPEKGMLVAEYIKALAGSYLSAKAGNPIGIVEYATKQFGKDARITKALSASVLSEGGATIAEEMATDIIELLRPASVFRRLNPTTVPMTNGVLNMPKLTGGATAGYIGENANVAATQGVFGNVKAVAKKLAALVPVSNDLIRRTEQATNTVIRDDLVNAITQRSDLAFIRGDGTLDTPRGLRSWAPSANLLLVDATVNLANVTIDLGRIVLALVEGNVRMIRPGWLFAPRTWNFLMTIRDGNGNFAFRDEMLTGTLWGFPWEMSNQIPINLAVTDTDESEIYFADFADVVIAETTSLDMAVSTEAAYDDGGTLVSAFSLDQTVLRAIIEHDLILRHDASVAVLIDVDWV